MIFFQSILANRGVDGKGAAGTAHGTNTLGIHGRERAGSALHRALAAAVRTNRALTRSDTVATVSTLSALTGSGGALSRSGRLVGRSAGLTAGDGGRLAATVLLDGHLLEHGVSLFGGRVDGEYHALAAVTLLAAVEPEGSLDGDLHGDLGGGRDGVVGVGHEASVHAAVNLCTGLSKGGLRDGVVLREELEDDGIANRHVELLRLEDETAGAANLDGVRSTGRLHESRCLASRQARAADVGGYADSDGLRNGDALVDGSSGRAGARVGPDDDNLLAATTGDDDVLGALVEEVELGLTLDQIRGHGQRGGSEKGGCPLHICCVYQKPIKGFYVMKVCKRDALSRSCSVSAVFVYKKRRRGNWQESKLSKKRKDNEQTKRLMG